MTKTLNKKESEFYKYLYYKYIVKMTKHELGHLILALLCHNPIIDYDAFFNEILLEIKKHKKGEKE